MLLFLVDAHSITPFRVAWNTDKHHKIELSLSGENLARDKFKNPKSLNIDNRSIIWRSCIHKLILKKSQKRKRKPVEKRGYA